jgi:hypothetical protein
MNSFNHMPTAHGEWLYPIVAGVEIDPNSRVISITFSAASGGGLTQAKAEVLSLYGPWLRLEIKDKKMLLNLCSAQHHGDAICPTPARSVRRVKNSKVDGLIASEAERSAWG